MSSIHIREVRKEIAISFTAGTNLMLISEPGLGKTMEAERAAADIMSRVAGAKLWKFDVGTANPNDLCAYMPDLKTGKLQVYPNGVLPNAYDDPDQTGIVLFDEVLNADNMTLKMFQKYINGEDISGKLRKPVGVIVVMMSNRLSDKAGVIQQSRAFLRRTEQLQVYSDPAHNHRYADENAFFPVVVKFFEKFPQCISNYDQVYYQPRLGTADALNRDDREAATEEGKNGIWANMGSWERVSKLEYAAQQFGKQLNPSRVIANVGRVVGQSYVVYRAMFDKMATYKQIVADPKNAPIPTKIDELYITVNMLTMMIDEAEIEPAAKYINRLQGDIRSMAIHRIIRREQRSKGSFVVSSSKAFEKWVTDPVLQDLFGGK